MYIKVKFLIYLFVLLLLCSKISMGMGSKEVMTNKTQYEKLEIYHVSWDLMTRVGLSAEDVIRMRHIYMAVNDAYIIEKVINKINKHNFVLDDQKVRHDARLVLVFSKSNSEKSLTYYASRNKLINKESNKVAKLDKNLLDLLDVFNQSDKNN